MFDDGDLSYNVQLDTPAGMTGATEYEALAPVTVSVKIIDDDTGGATFAPTELTVTEGDATGKTFTAVLTASPPTGVTVWVGLVPHCKITVGGRECTRTGNLNLSFTTASWNTAQTVVVKGVHDNDGENETVLLKYALLGFGAPVDVPDTAEGHQTAVTVDGGGRRRAGAGGASDGADRGRGRERDVHGAARVEPSAAVTVDVEKAAGGSTDVSFAPIADLVFAAGTWNTA